MIPLKFNDQLEGLEDNLSNYEKRTNFIKNYFHYSVILDTIPRKLVPIMILPFYKTNDFTSWIF